MATRIDSIEATLTANAKSFEKGLSDARDAVFDTEQAFKELDDALGDLEQRDPSKAFKDLGGVLVGVGAALGGIATAIGLAGLKTAQSASDFEQTGSLIERVFKGGSGAVEAFAATTASDLGLSLQETRQGLVSLGAQLKNTLGDTTAATQQSKALVKLAADLSAAQNVPFADTLERIQSGLRGEAEGIEKLNIFIGESALKQEALTLGITKSTEKMNEQEKTALRLSAIYRQTADLTGAAAAEAETFAGQTQRLDADMKNLSTEIGTAVLPTALKLVQAVRAGIAAFRDLDPETKNVIVGLTGVAGVAAGLTAGAIAVGAAVAALGPILGAVATAAGVTSAAVGVALVQALGFAVAASISFVAAFEITGAVLDALGFKSVGVGGALGAIADGFSTATDGARGFISTMVNVASVLVNFTPLGIAFGLVGENLGDSLNQVAESIIESADEVGILTKEDLEAIKATDDLSEATDAARRALVDTGIPLANTAEALSFVKKQENEAAKAAKEHTKELEAQAKALVAAAKASDALSKALAQEAARSIGPESQGAITGIFQDRENRIADTVEKGSASDQIRDITDDLANIEIIFLRKLGDALAAVPADEFVDAMDSATAELSLLGFGFEDVVDASPDLARRFDALGVGAKGATKQLEDLSKVDLSPVTREQRRGSIGGAVSGEVSDALGLTADLDSAFAGDVSSAINSALAGGLDTSQIGSTIGTVAGGAIGSVIPGIGTAIGAQLGAALGQAAQSAAESLLSITGVVSRLFGKVEGPAKVLADDMTDLAKGLLPILPILGPILGVLAVFLVVAGAFFVLAAATASLISQTKGFARAQESIALILNQIITPFEPFGAQMAALVAVVARVVSALSPVIVVIASIFGPAIVKELFAGVKLVGIVLLTFAAAVATVTNLFAAEEDKIDVGDIRGSINDLLDLSFEDALAEGVGIEGNQGLFDELRGPVVSAGTALDDLRDSSTSAAESTAGLSEELHNATSDFKVAAFRFAAQDAASATPSAGGFAPPLDSGSGRAVQIGTVTVIANDPQALFRELALIGDQQSVARRGSTGALRDYIGRGE